MRKTKILATLGPSTNGKEKIAQLIKAGANCFRFNLKHNKLSWHENMLKIVRQVSKDLKTKVATYMVLQGPEVRIATFPNGFINIKKGETVALSPNRIKKYQTIPLMDEKIIKDLKTDNTVYIDDAFIELKVIKKIKNACLCKVIEGEVVKSNKGINFPDLNLNLPSLSKKDIKCLSLAKTGEIDYIGLSFVRTVNDLLSLKREMAKQNINAKVIAKIETKAAIKNINDIIDNSDGILIARGDLAVEFDFAKVPFIQKEIINTCREKAKPVIVATQMLQSMINNPRPSRAEASDVANAVYDSADCLMLSEETAAGKFPIKAVKTMDKIARFIETKKQREIFKIEVKEMNEVITRAAYNISHSYYAHDNNVNKIIVLTETGKSAQLLARFRPQAKIIAISSSKKTVKQLILSYGVKSFYYHFPQGQLHSTRGVIECLKKRKVLKRGEKTLLIHGETWGTPARTNTLRIQEVY